MADSHGRPETIAAAADFLRSRRCRRIYHLGDICDSVKPATVENCVSLLRENGIYAIKGNNDHAVVVNQPGRIKLQFSPESLDYLKALPLMRRYKGAHFTHSLPFLHERGLSSMIGTMGEAEARLFFNSMPSGILFRGHGHTPEVIFMNHNEIRFHSLEKGEVFSLSQNMPCIITCGALTRGLCMIWKPYSGMICCLDYGTL